MFKLFLLGCLVVTFNASAGAAAVSALLRNITYLNSNTTDPAAANRTVRFVLSDGDGGTSLGSDATIAIALNTPPELTASAANPTFTEDGIPVVLDGALTVTDANDTNLESATVRITAGFQTAQDLLGFVNTPLITGTFNPVTGILSLTGSATPADYQTALRGVTYQNTSQNPNTAARGVTFVANDGSVNSNTITKTVTVLSVNDAPSFTASNPPTILEDAGPQTVSPWATAIDDGEPGVTQALTFNVTNNNPGLFSAPPSVSPSDGALSYTPAADANGTAIVTVTLSDDGGTDNVGDDTSDLQTFTITVTAVNDAPSFTPPANPAAVIEDSGSQMVTNFVMGISPGPGESGQTVSFVIDSNTSSGLFSGQPSISATGALAYTPAANQNGTATITFHALDNGGTDNNGANTSGQDSFIITVNAVNDPPVPQPKSFNAQANMQIQGLTGFLSGVVDADAGVNGCTPTFTLTGVGATSPAGGNVTITDSANGIVTFDPPPGATGNVTFSYTVTDNGCPLPAQSGIATATVNVASPVIWFVDAAVAGPGDGRLSNPFKTLASADAVDAANHRIFLYTGTYTTGLSLNTGEALVGQGATGANFDALFVISPPAGTIARPSIGGTRPQLNGTVAVAENSVVRGLNIVTSGATGLTGGAVSGVTVNEASVSATNATAVNLNSGGAFTLTRVDSSNAANGIVLNNNPAGSFTVTGTGAAGTGGTIQNITTRGASFINASNISLTNMNFTNASQNDGPTAPDGVVGGNSDENGAIHLQSAANVALTGVTITTTAQHGINGNGVRNLDLTNVTISGTGNEVWESGMFISNLAGRVSASQDSVFQNVNISNTGQFNVFITNGTPTAAAPAEKDRLSISNSQFSNSGINVIGDHITVANVGTANFQTLVSGSSFAALVDPSTHTSDNIQIDASESSNSDASISTSTFSNAGQAAINLSASGNGVGTFSVTNNSNISVRAATGINLASTGPASLRGTISVNTISTNVTNNPAFGIQFVVNDFGSIIARINNNTINGNGSTDLDYGIRGGARIGNGTADITLQDNSVQSARSAGVWLFSGNASPGETSRTCVNFVSNLVDGDPVDAFTDYFVEQYTNTTFQIQGLVGSGTNATNVQNFIAATDDDPAAGDPTVDAGSGTTVNYTNATCATP